MRYSHVRSHDRPSNRPRLCHARTIVSVHRVFRVEGRPEHAVAVADQRRPVAFELSHVDEHLTTLTK